MSDSGDSALTFDRQGGAWGSAAAGWGDEGEGGGEQYLELIGSQLWVAGTVDLGRFRRVSDFVNIVQGYLIVRDAVVLTRAGEATRLAMPELRVLPDDLAVVGQLDAELSQPVGDSGVIIEKRPQRLVLLTRSHLVDGDVFIHGDGSVMAFVDATDPKFIPMTDVRVRWLSDRALAARYPFALVQRSQILGVATEGIRLATTDTAARRAALLQRSRAGGERDELSADEAGSADDPLAGA